MDQKKFPFYLLIAIAVVVNIAGINNRFFTDDPALYASIAKNLLHQKSILELFTYNQNWLDKPHFPFWIIAISFKLFGISEWAYRLPALLFFLLSLIYTYRLSKKYYGSQTALMAVLILATALHIMLSNADVRAEPYLMALLTGSIYHISNLKDKFKISDFFLAAILMAAAIMTKGIFVIIPLGGSLLTQLFFNNDLKALFSLRWLFLVLFTVILITPELYSLYLQFDLHPEKLVFGTHHVSGIKWFFWDSQFGRFVNNGPISRKAQGNVFFYLHTLLWALAPWCVVFYLALFKKLTGIYKKQLATEYYALGGAVVFLLIFSLSRFQLPFYTNAVFPLFAIITAPVITAPLGSKASKFRSASLWLFVIALPTAVLVLYFFIKPCYHLFFWIDCLLFIIGSIWIAASNYGQINKAFFMACCTALFVGFFLNTVFYKVLTAYNGQIAAASYLNLKPFQNFPVYTLNERDNAFQFYSHKPVIPLKPDEFVKLKRKAPALFYARQSTVDYFIQNHIYFNVIRSFINYPQENILPKFINAGTRGQVLNKVYIISQ